MGKSKRSTDHSAHAKHAVLGLRVLSQEAHKSRAADDEENKIVDENPINVPMNLRIECDGRVLVEIGTVLALLRAFEYKGRLIHEAAQSLEELHHGTLQAEQQQTVQQIGSGLMEMLRANASEGSDEPAPGMFL